MTLEVLELYNPINALVLLAVETGCCRKWEGNVFMPKTE